MSGKATRFHYGDLVRIAADLGDTMRHFPADREAVVFHSYDELYGGGDTDSYALHVEGQGRVSWYWGEQLTLIEHNRINLLEAWK